jgi:hypothetical protein
MGADTCTASSCKMFGKASLPSNCWYLKAQHYIQEENKPILFIYLVFICTWRSELHDFRESSCKKINEKWIGKCLEGKGCCLISGIIHDFACSQWGKPRISQSFPLLLGGLTCSLSLNNWPTAPDLWQSLQFARTVLLAQYTGDYNYHNK